MKTVTLKAGKVSKLAKASRHTKKTSGIKGRQKGKRQISPSFLISHNIVVNVKSGVDTRDFFKNYSRLAPLIKKMKKMKGAERKKADKAMEAIVKNMGNLQKMLSHTV